MIYPVINHRLSEVITWLRFPLILLIILLHCYSVEKIPGNHDTYFKVIYPFSLWLGETGVPAFFFISGFLFYFKNKSYISKLKARIHTLLLPYLIWNGALLILFLVLFILGAPQNINGTNMADYDLLDYIRLFWDRGSFDKGNFVPLLCPLWYIRNLLIMSIISPLLFYIIRYAREAFLFTIACWWMTTYNNAFIPQTILFFSLGAYFSIFGINPLGFFRKKKVEIIILFAIFGLCDILSHVLTETPVNLQIHRLSLILNIPVLFLVADYCIMHGIKSSKMLPHAAFIVFCIHYPIVVVLRKTCINLFSEESDFVHIILYFICIISATIISLTFYFHINKFFPKTKALLSGNR